MDRRRPATWLPFVVVVLFGGTLLLGALTAPSLGDAPDTERRTLVGSQSYEGGWAQHGEVYLLDNETKTWKEDAAPNYFDVTMLGDGTVLASFLDRNNTQGCGPYGSTCHKTGYQIIDPNAADGPAVVDEYSFPVRHETNSEVHAATPAGNGEVAVVDMDRERVFTVRNDQITWQWNASSFYTPPTDHNPPDDPTSNDWLHMNDVDPINDTHFLVSVRNANQLLVLERGNGVVEVINADRGGSDASCIDGTNRLIQDESGDVRCGDPTVLDNQHNPQWLGEGAVLVADSHNDRVVELHENETTGQWEPVWSVGGAEGVSFHWPRDADRLENGNTLITDTHNGRIVEVDANGTAVWSAVDAVGRIPYEADRLPGGELGGWQPNSSDASSPTATSSGRDGSDSNAGTQSNDSNAGSPTGTSSNREGPGMGVGPAVVSFLGAVLLGARRLRSGDERPTTR